MLMILKSQIPVHTALSRKLKIFWSSLLGCPHSTSNSSYSKQNTPSPPTLSSSSPFFLFHVSGPIYPFAQTRCLGAILELPSLPLHTQSISASSMGPSLHLTCHPPICESDSPLDFEDSKGKNCLY